MPMRTVFTATIKIRNVNPYILVDAPRAAAIKEGWRKPLPVRLRISGLPRKAWRVNMMPVGDGSFYLYLHGTIREASGTAVGDRVEVEVAFDSRYRGGNPPFYRLRIAEYDLFDEVFPLGGRRGESVRFTLPPQCIRRSSRRLSGRDPPA